jgi:hypothetical protein
MLDKNGVTLTDQQFLSKVSEDFKNRETAMFKHAEKKIETWMREVYAVEVPLSLKQSTAAMESYFTGDKPFRLIKCKEDIPDGFIYQSIIEIKSEIKDTLYVGVEDKGLRAALSKIKGIKACKDLYALIKLDEFENELKKLDLEEENFTLLSKALSTTADVDASFTKIIEKEIGELLVGEEVLDSASDPFDSFDHEGVMVTSYNEPEKIKFTLDKLEYYGDGQIGIPFECQILVNGVYYIDKREYWSRQDDNYHGLPSVTSHNDHVYEAEGEFLLHVDGVISADFDLNELDFSNLQKTIEEADHNIEVQNVFYMELS